MELVYAHLLIARDVRADVLVDKVQKRQFSEREALQIAQMILHDNAIRIHRLDGRHVR